MLIIANLGRQVKEAADGVGILRKLYHSISLIFDAGGEIAQTKKILLDAGALPRV